jgi:SAM-dependent methyltransferase
MLDFGCASGRVLRHLAARGSAAGRYGVDLQPQAVRWARQHLSGVTVALTTVIPSLPFADASLDLVYAGSVFTHIDDFEEATLLELRRILKPSGIAVLTFHPARVWDDMAAFEAHHLRLHVLDRPNRLDPPGMAPVTAEPLGGPMPGERVVFTALEHPVNGANVIHSHGWIREHWGRTFSLEEIVEAAHGGHQDAAVLRRR